LPTASVLADHHTGLAYNIFTRHTLVWKAILIAVFSLCQVTDISATVTPIGVKFCTMVYIGPAHIFSPFGGGAPKRSSNPKFWA